MILTKGLSAKLLLSLLTIVVSNNIYNQDLAHVQLKSAGTIGNSLRISDRTKEQAAISNLHVRDTSTIHLYSTWNMYLYKPNDYHIPKLYTLNGTDEQSINYYTVSWSTDNAAVAVVANNVLTAKSPGKTLLTATVDGISVSVPLEVYPEVRPVEYTTDIDPYLTQPANGYTSLVPVVVICYIPTPDGQNVNTDEAGFAPISSQTIDNLKSHIKKISRHTKFSLEEGSKFRGYKNPEAIPYVGYKIIDYIFVYEPVPRGFQNPAGSSFFGDYNNIITRFNGKRYVDTLGVKEFWLMGYDKGEIVPVESNMSSPTTGDISNSYHFQDDLPIYSKTYVLYNYNYTREGNESTHNHGHQIETMVDYVATIQDHSINLFRNNFRGYTNVSSAPFGRCGDTHHPPNTMVDYDYYNYTFVASDIMDWKPEGGTQTMVNASTWGNINYNWPTGSTPNIESNWYVFWMQSLPGQGNQIPYNTKVMTNWWQFLSNWDSATAKIGLYQNNVVLPLTLNSFSAYNVGDVNDLKWQMSVDDNTAYAEVQRSEDGMSFIKIGNVSFVSGTAVHNYAYTDALPIAGHNYYRLKIFDKNGGFTYSSVAMVDRNAKVKIRISPNPATNILTVSGLNANRESSLELFNINGSRVVLIKTSQAVKTIDISKLPAGGYVLKIFSEGKVVSQKVTKQ